MGTPEQQATETPAPLFELNLTEITFDLKVSKPGRRFQAQHVLRGPRADDWLAFERAWKLETQMVESPEAQGDELAMRTRMDTAEAQVALWDRLALRVSGYPHMNGEAAGWKELVPVSSKQLIATALANVHAAELTDDDVVPTPALGEDLIVLDAVRGKQKHRLFHFFRSPSADHQMRYKRIVRDTLVVGGTRRPGSREIYPPRLPSFLPLYDELILRVEGYAWDGRPAEQTGKELAARMDAWHKRAAVVALFGDEEAELIHP